MQAVNAARNSLEAVALTPKAPMRAIPAEALAGGARAWAASSGRAAEDPLAGRNVILQVGKHG